MVVESNKVKELSAMANDVLDAVLPDVESHGLWAVEFIKRHGAQIARAAGDEQKAADWDACFSSGELPSSDETAVDGNGIIARARTRSQHRRSEKERQQVIADAKRDAVQMSAYMATAEEFKENRDKEEAVGMAPRGVLTASGCYVLVTMPSGMSKDFAEYEDVYVGAGFPLATAVYDQLIGDGDPDVYADFKYGQPVQMLLYPCDKDEMELLRASLIVDFQAYDSYNAREIRHSVTQDEDEAPAVTVAEEAWAAAVAAVEEAEEEAANEAAAQAKAQVEAEARVEAAKVAEAVEAAGVTAVEVAAVHSAQAEAARAREKQPANAQVVELPADLQTPVSSAPAAGATMVLSPIKPAQASGKDSAEGEGSGRGRRRRFGSKNPSADIHLAPSAREEIFAQAAGSPDATVLLGAVPTAGAAAKPQAAKPQPAKSQAAPRAAEASDGEAPARDTSGFDVLWSEEPQEEEEPAPEQGAVAPEQVPEQPAAAAESEVEAKAEEGPSGTGAVDTSGFDVLWSEEPQEKQPAPRIMNVPHVGAAEEDLMDEIQDAGGSAELVGDAPSPSVSASQQFAQVEDPWDEDAFDEELLEEALEDDAPEEKDA